MPVTIIQQNKKQLIRDTFVVVIFFIGDFKVNWMNKV